MELVNSLGEFLLEKMSNGEWIAVKMIELLGL